MRLYERTDGTIAGTQAEAGKGFTQIEVPTDKAGLIDYLNRNRHIPCPCNGAGAPTPAPEPLLAAPTPAPKDNSTCPRCRFDRRGAERSAQHMAESITLDALCERIDKAEGGALTRLVEAVTSRLSWVARSVSA